MRKFWKPGRPHPLSEAPAPIPTPAKKYYPYVDGFRALAIIFILARHARDGFQLKEIFKQDSPSLMWLYDTVWHTFHLDLSSFYLRLEFFIQKIKGLYGVEIFLVLSGFLITGMLFKEGRQAMPAGTFYARRFWKIYPRYFLLVAISTWLFWVRDPNGVGNIWLDAARHLLFLQNYFVTNPFLAHTWTLVVIEQFYFFCPLVIAAVCACTPSPRVRRWLLIAMSLAVIALASWTRYYYQQTGHALITWPLQAPVFVQTTLFRCDAIAFGCLLALTEPYWGAVRRNRWVGLALWCSGIGIYNYLVHHQWNYYNGNWYMFSLGFIGFGCLFLAAHHGVSLLAGRQVLQRMGRYALGIYLWHYLLLPVWGTVWPVLPLPLVVAGYLTSCIVVGILSTWTLEKYFLNIREKFAPKIQMASS